MHAGRVVREGRQGQGIAILRLVELWAERPWVVVESQRDINITVMDWLRDTVASNLQQSEANPTGNTLDRRCKSERSRAKGELSNFLRRRGNVWGEEPGNNSPTSEFVGVVSRNRITNCFEPNLDGEQLGQFLCMSGGLYR